MKRKTGRGRSRNGRRTPADGDRPFVGRKGRSGKYRTWSEREGEVKREASAGPPARQTETGERGWLAWILGPIVRKRRLWSVSGPLTPCGDRKRAERIRIAAARTRKAAAVLNLSPAILILAAARFKMARAFLILTAARFKKARCILRKAACFLRKAAAILRMAAAILILAGVRLILAAARMNFAAVIVILAAAVLSLAGPILTFAATFKTP